MKKTIKSFNIKCCTKFMKIRMFVRDSDKFINKTNPEMLNFDDDSIQVIELR